MWEDTDLLETPTIWETVRHPPPSAWHIKAGATVKRRQFIEDHFGFYSVWRPEVWSSCRSVAQADLCPLLHKGLDAREIGDVYFQYQVDFLTWYDYVKVMDLDDGTEDFEHGWPWGDNDEIDPSDMSDGISKEYKAWREANGHPVSEPKQKEKASVSPKQAPRVLPPAKGLADSEWAPGNREAVVPELDWADEVQDAADAKAAKPEPVKRDHKLKASALSFSPAGPSSKDSQKPVVATPLAQTQASPKPAPRPAPQRQVAKPPSRAGSSSTAAGPTATTSQAPPQGKPTGWKKGAQQKGPQKTAPQPAPQGQVAKPPSSAAGPGARTSHGSTQGKPGNNNKGAKKVPLRLQQGAGYASIAASGVVQGSKIPVPRDPVVSKETKEKVAEATTALKNFKLSNDAKDKARSEAAQEKAAIEKALKDAFRVRFDAELARIRERNIKVDKEPLPPVWPMDAEFPIRRGFWPSYDVGFAPPRATKLELRQHIWDSLALGKLGGPFPSPFEVVLPPWIDFADLVLGTGSTVLGPVMDQMPREVSITWTRSKDGRPCSLVMGPCPEMNHNMNDKNMLKAVRTVWCHIVEWTAHAWYGRPRRLADFLATQVTLALAMDASPSASILKWARESWVEFVDMQDFPRAKEAKDELIRWVPEIHAILRQPKNHVEPLLNEWVEREGDLDDRLFVVMDTWSVLAPIHAFKWNLEFEKRRLDKKLAEKKLAQKEQI
ncbi:hypothetical protein FPSE_12393 [Fusarium pseudograminearum CS3096]|uniref:Uncharacterized protein n=2 Tax=Fusarium pseudograminearum TaxID=101028 RepID=K3U8A8_FUSPC|nr:hypothetical protein FPSE_12393 [Fusarium pseudograminearum CS3096]EKJ67426.1 hypothetical protein FPSE_12393 [Fusarium pseudograminearum CS3096]CEG02890.1 unnamed protein product [Fusarium pseudograminearum CS3487]